MCAVRSGILDATCHRLCAALALVMCAACGESRAVADAAPEAAADAGAEDAGPDVDNGAPSTDYPAPHPPMPELVNAMGGPVLASPKVKLVFYPGYTLEPYLTTFAQAMSTSTYWTQTTSEYGVGSLAYSGAVDLADTPPATITQAAVHAWIASELQGGAFGTPDPQTIYTVVYPKTTTVTQPNPVSALLGDVKSCQAFLGYHDNVSVAIGDAGAQSFAYAVIPTCGGLDSLTETLSHEWIEAATDPQVTAAGVFTLTGGPSSAFFGPDADHAIWALLAGGEAGDLCSSEGAGVFVTPADLARPAQRTWSNASAKASHDPCVPRPAGAFFAAAPVLPETVSFESTLTGKVTSKGVTIAQGESKTVEVDLFSDGDTQGAFVVSAADVLSTYYGSYGLKPTLTFAWDRTSGLNGEKLHLTITVTGASPVGGAHAFMITSSLRGRQSVWPGLIVE